MENDENVGKLVKTTKTMHAYSLAIRPRVPIKSGTFQVVPAGSLGVITETVLSEDKKRTAGYRICVLFLGITNFVDAESVEFII